MKKDLIIACPTCKKSLRWQDCEEHRPFCSKRCQLIDLGEWANEKHAIPGSPSIEKMNESEQPTELHPKD